MMWGKSSGVGFRGKTGSLGEWMTKWKPPSTLNPKPLHDFGGLELRVEKANLGIRPSDPLGIPPRGFRA